MTSPLGFWSAQWLMSDGGCSPAALCPNSVLPGEFNIKARVVLVGFHQFVIELCPRPVNGEEIFEIL